eukprot:scaffold130208_cov69-Phaeocystis_antarctica.AAC.4
MVKLTPRPVSPDAWCCVEGRRATRKRATRAPRPCAWDACGGGGHGDWDRGPRCRRRWRQGRDAHRPVVGCRHGNPDPSPSPSPKQPLA